MIDPFRPLVFFALEKEGKRGRREGENVCLAVGGESIGVMVRRGEGFRGSVVDEA